RCAGATTPSSRPNPATCRATMASARRAARRRSAEVRETIAAAMLAANVPLLQAVRSWVQRAQQHPPDAAPVDRQHPQLVVVDLRRVAAFGDRTEPFLDEAADRGAVARAQVDAVRLQVAERQLGGHDHPPAPQPAELGGPVVLVDDLA